MLYGLTQSAEAPADPAVDIAKEMQPIVGGTPLSSDFLPSKSSDNEPLFSSNEFRRRKTSMLEAPPGLLEEPPPGESDAMSRTPPTQTTSAWQRLADYRSQGRVQLLTLWESKQSTVSLQAGKHGGPSLQWSGRLTTRGSTTRGLLDRFLASSLGAAGLGSKAGARNGNSTPLGRSINLLPVSRPSSSAAP